MKREPAFNKLVSLARIARAHIELLARTERREVGECDWQLGNIAGYCGIAARYLERFANEEGIHPIFCVGLFQNYNRILGKYKPKSGHAWLKYKDYIIDITASQFVNSISRIERNFNIPVYICKYTNPHFLEQYVGPTAKELITQWYVEPLDEICDKARHLALESKLKFPSFRK